MSVFIDEGASMEIKINKEVLNYTESIVMGLTIRQCFFSAIACIVAVIIYFSANETLGTETTSWLCMIGAAPFAALGFISYQGMNAEQVVIHAWRSFRLMHTDLMDQPMNLYFEMYKDLIENKKKEVLGKNDKKLFKVKETKQR